MKKFILILLTIILIINFSGCSNNIETNKDVSESSLTVYTSFYSLYDFTSKIGGDKINVINLIPPGTEPHHWEPTPKDIVSLENADIFIYNGAGMESWIDDILNSLSNKSLITLEASKDVVLLENTHNHEDNSHEESLYDPHVWLDPQNTKLQMKAIKDILIENDPDNKEYYLENYYYYANKIDELDMSYKEAIDTFTQKDIIVSHSAFSYLCNAYGLNQVAIEGLNGDTEPSPGKMGEIVDYANANNVKVIFFAESVTNKVANTIANEVGAKVEVLNPLEVYTQDEIDAGADYFTIMESNLEKLKIALQ